MIAAFPTMNARPKHPTRRGRPAPSARMLARAAIHGPPTGRRSSDTSIEGAENPAEAIDESELITRVGAERTCAGCGEKGAPQEMIRVVLGPPGAPASDASPSREIAIDAGSGSFGRGAHIHPQSSCVAAAAQKGLQRSFKSALTIDGARVDATTLSNAIADYANRRIEGLLGAARRAHRMALGADAVVSASRAGDAHLIVVATDASSAADLSEVRRAVAEGRAVAWATKERLASAAGGADRAMGLGVVAITDTRIARAVREAAQLVDAMLNGATTRQASHQKSSSRTSLTQAASTRVEAGEASATKASKEARHTTRDDRGQAHKSDGLTASAAQGERRGGATIQPRSDVDGQSPRPEKGADPSDDGSQAVE